VDRVQERKIQVEVEFRELELLVAGDEQIQVGIADQQLPARQQDLIAADVDFYQAGLEHDGQLA